MSISSTITILGVAANKDFHKKLIKEIKEKQAVAELCQAQVQFNLDSDFLGEDLYIFIQKLDQEFKILKHNIQMQSRCNIDQHVKNLTNRCNSDVIQINRSRVRSADRKLEYRFTDQNIEDQIQFRCTYEAIQMHFRCNFDAIQIKSRYIFM